MIKITKSPIDVDEIISSVGSPGSGAIDVFLGVVRDHSKGKKTLYLEYDAYPEMAEKLMTELADEIRSKWTIEGIAMVHRTGRLEIGESSVVIAVSSAHRKTAFEACQYAIDRLKKTVPIWKKEYFEDGEVWVEEGDVAKMTV